MEQDRQCTYNVTLRRVRANMLQWESNEYDTNCLCVFVALGIQ